MFVLVIAARCASVIHMDVCVGYVCISCMAVDCDILHRVSQVMLKQLVCFSVMNYTVVRS